MNGTVNLKTYSEIDNFDDLRKYHDRLRASNDYQNSNDFYDILVDSIINTGRVLTGREPLLDPTPPQHSQAIDMGQTGALAAVLGLAARYGLITSSSAAGAITATPSIITAVISSAGGRHATEYANALDVLDIAAKGELFLTQDGYYELARILAAGTFPDKVALIEEQLQDAASQSDVNSITLDAVPDTRHCFLAPTPITMWPRDPSLRPRPDGTYDEARVLAGTWTKPISDIAVGDVVLAYDDKGRLVPRPVLRTMTNRATHI